MSRLRSCRHSLPLFLEFVNDSFSKFRNTDVPVPWSWLRSSEELGQMFFSRDLEPKYGPSQDARNPENNSHLVKLCECGKYENHSTTKNSCWEHCGEHTHAYSRALSLATCSPSRSGHCRQRWREDAPCAFFICARHNVGSPARQKLDSHRQSSPCAFFICARHDASKSD